MLLLAYDFNLPKVPSVYDSILSFHTFLVLPVASNCQEQIGQSS